jgi:hypothetical protein
MMPEIAPSTIEVGVFELVAEISGEPRFPLRQLTGLFLCLDTL